MHRTIRIVSVALVGMLVLTGSSYAPNADDRSEILKVRESVWRAWFANDTKASRNWCHQILLSSAQGRTNGRPRPKSFNRSRAFKRKVES